MSVLIFSVGTSNFVQRVHDERPMLDYGLAYGACLKQQNFGFFRTIGKFNWDGAIDLDCRPDVDALAIDRQRGAGEEEQLSSRNAT